MEPTCAALRTADSEAPGLRGELLGDRDARDPGDPPIGGDDRQRVPQRARNLAVGEEVLQRLAAAEAERAHPVAVAPGPHGEPCRRARPGRAPRGRGPQRGRRAGRELRAHLPAAEAADARDGQGRLRRLRRRAEVKRTCPCSTCASTPPPSSTTPPSGSLTSRQISAARSPAERHLRARGAARPAGGAPAARIAGSSARERIAADRAGGVRTRLGQRLGRERARAPRPPRPARPGSRRSSPRPRARSRAAPAAPRCGSGCAHRAARRWSGRRGRAGPPPYQPPHLSRPSASSGRTIAPRRGRSPSSARRPGEVASR